MSLASSCHGFLKLKNVYFYLLFLRICFSLFGTGYIHPDEYFQNGEVTAGQILGLHTLRTWEWDPDFPCRSIVPPALTTGIPFTILGLIFKGKRMSPLIVFRTQRLAFLCLSFVLDYCVFQLFPDQGARIHALILFASSFVAHTFLIRPFSNSIEAILVAISLLILRKLLVSTAGWTETQKLGRGMPYLMTFALVSVLGTYTRLTFIAFAFPVALEICKWTLQRVSSAKTLRCSRSLTRASLLLLLGFVSIVAAFVLTMIDTVYFRGNLSTPVLTPVNFLLYNISPDNLAEHGLHPRWLHVFVNLPMVVGPGLVYYGILAGAEVLKTPGKSEQGVVESMKKTCVYVIVASLAVLSVQPHQEPRFLIPLLVPFIVLVVQSGRVQRAGRLFWATWFVVNIILGVIFGIFHQGGIVPSLFYLHDEIDLASTKALMVAERQTVDVIYWKTYMPPFHLLNIPKQDVRSGQITLTDLAGATSDALIQRLCAPSSTNTQTFLVAPLYTGLHVKHSNCIQLQTSFFPHLDLDHLSETVAVGLKDGLRLGVHVVDTDCIRRSMLASSVSYK
ncbi:hypothetical protein AcW1_006188 [Taiwanofungus camphoratus]|nr:hypothetical protein AcW2_004946 [Antrodia cinnamomea]KAI0934767.1 hypothetical protein AcV5_006506 [Antrodia cinnamomea]KAI0957966.1 hypothetical protein AcW1_006188 [Antrodia cinnamomea]